LVKEEKETVEICSCCIHYCCNRLQMYTPDWEKQIFSYL